jgi:hypothetical protein
MVDDVCSEQAVVETMLIDKNKANGKKEMHFIMIIAPYYV